MKKYFIIILIVLIVIISSLVRFITDYKQQRGEIEKFNLQFEKYQEEIPKGTDVATIINSAVDNNEKHNIEKDNEGKYKDDNTYCVRVEVIMNSVIDETKDRTYAMEDIYSLGMDRFIRNFNLIEFKCVDINYNSIGRVNKITFELKE